jgi:hypothetical protein
MRRVRTGEIVAGVAGALLLLSTFLEWYTVRGRAEGLTAWGAFSFVDLLVAVVALLGMTLAASQVIGRGPALPVALGVITTTLGLAAALLVLYRILNQPGPNDVIGVGAGAWIGLAASLGVFLGAWLSLSDERSRPVDPPAPVPERRPTPART